MLELKDLPKPEEFFIRGSLGKFRLEDTHSHLAKLAEKLGPIYGLRLLTKKMVVISDAETVGYILKSRPERFRRIRQIEAVFSELGMHGTFSTEAEEWIEHRKLLNPAFRPSSLKACIQSIQDIVDRLCNVIEKCSVESSPPSETYDFQMLIQRFAVDVTSALAFGFDLNTLENPESELQKSFEIIFSQIASRLKSPFPYWRYVKFKKDRELEESMRLIRSQGKRFIESASDHIKAGNEPRNLLENVLKHGNASQEKVLGNVVTLLLAGEDTTANTIAWTMHYLLDDITLQNQLFDEIQSKYPKNRALEWQDLSDFVLVNGAIKESLRLKPVAPLLYIEPIQDECLLGYRIPAGTMMTILLSANNENHDVFPSPKHFDPFRWSEGELDRLSSGVLFPFGSGPRQCPGMQLALIEAKLVLIEILRKFEFRRVLPTIESFEFTVKPRNLVVTSNGRMAKAGLVPIGSICETA